MNRRRGGLGSGLDALMPNDMPSGVREVPISSVRQNPRQPRTQFDETALDELAASISEHGVIQPLIVSEQPNGTYELIAGERRWRASQRAGLERVPVVVRETTPQQLLELALIENVQRADLNALEEALAYQALKDEFSLNDEQIAKRVGKNSRETIANARRLLQLPAQAQDALLRKQISAGHGRALLKLKSAEQQLAALEAVTQDELSVREAERLSDLVDANNGDVASALAALRGQSITRARPESAKNVKATAAPKPQANADDTEVSREIERIIGTPVNIARSERDVRVTLVFHTEEKLQEFFDLLNGSRA